MRMRGLAEDFKADGTEQALVVLQDAVGAQPSVTGSVTDVVEEQLLWDAATPAFGLLIPLHARCSCLAFACLMVNFRFLGEQ